MSSSDFDPEAEDFRRALQAARGPDSTAHGCPKPELLMAVRSAVAFEGSEAVEHHLAVCPLCQQLTRDLADYEFPAVSDSEDRRIRARWQTAENRRPTGLFRGWRVPALLAAVASVILVALFVRQPRQAPHPQIAPQATPSAVFTLIKPAVKIPASAVLTLRGKADAARAYHTDLAAALEPYRADDYAESARRLEPLVQKYPEAPEPPYYLGVSQLFLNRNDAAIESLQTARLRSGATLRDDISWYLAVAFDRAANTGGARREVEALCAGTSEYKDSACTAANRLRAR